MTSMPTIESATETMTPTVISDRFRTKSATRSWGKNKVHDAKTNVVTPQIFNQQFLKHEAASECQKNGTKNLMLLQTKKVLCTAIMVMHLADIVCHLIFLNRKEKVGLFNMQPTAKKSPNRGEINDRSEIQFCNQQRSFNH